MSKHRDTFYTEIEKGLIGPGSDIFEVDDKEELISDYPLNRYYSGILFPEKTFPTGKPTPRSEEEKENSDNLAYTDKDDYNNSFEEQRTSDDSGEGESEKSKEDKEDYSQTSDVQDFQISQNTFFPTHIGFTLCMEPKKSIKVTFSFGIYDQLELPSPEIKIAISKEGFESFFDTTIEIPLSFKDALSYENGFMFLIRKLRGSQRSPRDGEYKDFDEFRKKGNIGKKEAYKYIHLLERLLGRVWKREQITRTKEI